MKFWVRSGTLEVYVVAFDPREAAIKALRQMLPTDRLGLLIGVYPLKEDGYTVNKDESSCRAFVTECLANDVGILLREVK